MPEKGRLFLCGTPIGNLGDISLRTLETLKQVDLIACEDTRQTRKLLNHFKINTPLTSYYEHNKEIKGGKLIEQLLGGKDIALVSDAGMPGIADPGQDLVQACIKENIEFTVIPGPVALITGLVLSGFNTTSFCFEGFVPRSKRDKRRYFQKLEKEERTIIFYEAPHRLLETLNILKDIFGERQIALCRELTKKFEEVYRGSIEEALDYFTTKGVKGEFTLIIDGAKPEINIKDINWATERFKQLVEEGQPAKEAVKVAAKEAQINKRDLYEIVMKK